MKYKGSVLIGSATNLRQHLLACFHDSSIGGHSMTQGTYQRMKNYLYWPDMKRDVEAYDRIVTLEREVNMSIASIMVSYIHWRYSSQAWQHISMDFIEGSPKSFGSNVIYVVIDRFTNYAHFIHTNSHYTARSVAKAFFDHVFKLHGLPTSIVSYRDKVFASIFWQ